MMLISLASNHDDYDVLLIDDHSDKYDQNEKAERWGVDTLRWGEGTEPPRGLTHSWNLAWRYALEHEYKYLIICNNDLLIPDGTITKLVNELETNDWDWINPIVSERGSFYPKHNLKLVYGDDVQEWTDHPLFYAEVATSLDHIPKRAVIKVDKEVKKSYMNGYAMAFHVNNIKKFQFDASEALLFDPKFINAGNEDDLATRMARSGGRTGVHPTAFVYHHKGYTLYKSGTKGRDTTEGFPVLDDIDV